MPLQLRQDSQEKSLFTLNTGAFSPISEIILKFHNQIICRKHAGRSALFAQAVKTQYLGET